MTEPVLVTEGLTRSDVLDLLDHLPPGTAVERPGERGSGELGEPALIALALALTPAVLSGISAWLATRGKDVEVRFTAEGLGVKTGFSFTAKNDTTPATLTQTLTDAGALPPP